MKYRLQYLRAVAALLVVIWHASYHLWAIRGDNSLLLRTPEISGALGVTLFFVISGYLMATLAVRNTASQFMLHRVIRIYPIYWLVVLTFFCINTLLGFGFTFDFLSLALMPGDGRAYPLGVEWTLPFELSFYLVVFLIVFVRTTRFLPVIAILWAVVIVVLLQVAPGLQQGQFPRLSHVLVSQWTLPFTLGLLIPEAIRRGVVTPHLWMLGFVFIALTFLFPDSTIYAIPVGCVCFVHWAVIPRQKERDSRIEIKSLTRLGDWSYALYLCHVPIVLWIFRLAPVNWSGALLWSASIVLSLVAAAGFGTIDLAMYRRLKAWVDMSSNAALPVEKVGAVFAALFLMYGGYAEAEAWHDARLTAFANKIGQQIALSHPSTSSEVESAAAQAQLQLDPGLDGFVDQLTCSTDGSIEIRGWAAERAIGSTGIAVLVFNDGAYWGSATPELSRPDVVKALHLSHFRQTPGFAVQVRGRDCRSSCARPSVIVVKGNRYELLHANPQVDQCRVTAKN
jgi:exopolysaccharide production protein ExoZ